MLTCPTDRSSFFYWALKITGSIMGWQTLLKKGREETICGQSGRQSILINMVLTSLSTCSMPAHDTHRAHLLHRIFPEKKPCPAGSEESSVSGNQHRQHNSRRYRQDSGCHRNCRRGCAERLLSRNSY